jgi:hypothetical protein
MKPRSLVVLIALLAAVTLYFFLVEQKKERGRRDSLLESRKLLPYNYMDIDSTVFMNPYGNTIIWRREGDGWRITWPVEDDGDDPTIKLFLSMIAPGQKLEEYDDVSSFEEYGLVDPFASIILYSDRYARIDTVHIGDKTPTSFRAYVRLGDSRSVIVTRELAHNVMQKTLYHLRDKNLLHLGSDEVRTVTVISPGLRLELERSGAMWLIRGTRIAASAELIESWLTALLSSLIYEFAAEDTTGKGAFGIGDPAREVILETAGGESIQVSFGRRKDRYVPVTITGRPKVMMVDAGSLDAFDWIRESIIVMNLSLTMPGDVAGIGWESPDSSLTLKLSGDEWTAEDYAGTEIDSESVKYLLIVVRSAAFARLIEDPAELPEDIFEKFLLRIVLSDFSGSVIDVITISRAPDGRTVGTSITAGNSGYLRHSSLPDILAAFRAIGQ